MKRSNSGFTLVEMLVVVAMVGILGAVALPAYNAQVRKGKRAEGKTALMAVLQAQEKYRANCPLYASSLASSDACTATANTLSSPTKSASGLYDLALATVAASASTAFSATATAVAGSNQSNDTGCTVLTLTQSAGTVTTTPTTCW